jgi:hypothetical protein
MAAVTSLSLIDETSSSLQLPSIVNQMDEIGLATARITMETPPILPDVVAAIRHELLDDLWIHRRILDIEILPQLDEQYPILDLVDRPIRNFDAQPLPPAAEWKRGHNPLIVGMAAVIIGAITSVCVYC